MYIFQCTRLLPKSFFKICHLTVVLGQHRRELVAFAPLEVICSIQRHPQLPLEFLQLFTVSPTKAILLMQGSISLSDHVSELKVLRLDFTLKFLSLIYGLLSRRSFE